MRFAIGIVLALVSAGSVSPRPASAAAQAPHQRAVAKSVSVKPVAFTEDVVSDHETNQHMPVRLEGPDESGVRYVQMKLIIGTDGRVLSAVPLQGPREYYSRSVAEAITWRYVPFEKDGVAVKASIVDYVELLPPQMPKRPNSPPVVLK